MPGSFANAAGIRGKNRNVIFRQLCKNRDYELIIIPVFMGAVCTFSVFFSLACLSPAQFLKADVRGLVAVKVFPSFPPPASPAAVPGTEFMVFEEPACEQYDQDNGCDDCRP